MVKNIFCIKLLCDFNNCKSSKITMDTYFTVVLGCVLLFSSSTLGDVQTDILNDSNVGGHTKKVNLEEGEPLSISCHDSEASWTGPNGFRSSNEWLNISRVSTSDTGKYKCSSTALGNLLTIDLDVLTPPTIVSITVPKRVFGMREDFNMTVDVKGNPPPVTTLTHFPDGKVVFKKEGEGKHKIIVKNLNCTDGGIYVLTCNNTVGEKQVNESITVINKPALDPMFLPDQRISPRLGEAANFTAHIISCPPVLFMEWIHNSKPVKNHNDTDNSTELFIEDVGVADYGDYELLLRNNVGNVSIPFLVEAFGPPAPVSDIEISDVTDKSANISFMSGFDYNDTQTFMVMREVDGQLKGLVNVTDKPNDTGMPTSIVIEGLDETTSYSITIVSRTSRGNSPPAATYGNFTTYGSPKPDPKFPINHTTTPRLGDSASFTIHCLSDPEPSFLWLHNGKPVKGLDSNATCGSTIMVEKVKVADFGAYMLEMRNDYGEYNVSFEMLATGPPAPVSDIEISDVTDKSANISFMSGFDYNDTQTFMVMREVDGQLNSLVNVTDKPNDTGKPTSFVIEGLDETTSYSITIVSRTSRGNSPPAATYGNFTTYGSPKPDPKFPIDHTTTPRLGDSASFTIHCLSNPEPSFLWLHNGKPVKGLDSNMTCGSTIMVEKVKVADFGAYMLEMWNDYGEYNVSYEMLATGPPAPVTDLKITNISTTTATIMFTTGYNYNNTQTFIVEQKSGSKVITLTECNDTTDGKGGVELSCDLDGLKYFTMYQVTVASQNSAGKSIPTTGFIEFTTYGAPKPDPKFPITNKYKPRTSDTVKLTIHAIGEPVPTFQWKHGNTVFNGTDKGYMSTLELKGVKVEEFGNYTVTMTNEVGNHTTEFVLIPDGPPDAVTDLGTTNITTTSVTLTFKTGYDYGKKQIFTVMHNEDGKPEVLEVCNDTTTGKGGDMFSCKLDKLNQDTLYNVTVISENSEGESNATADTIQFTTYGAPKPDPKYPVNDKFKPRLGQKVNLTVHAIGYPVPKYEWMHDGKPVKSIDTDYSSTVDFEDMTVDEFGNYTVTITNPAGSYVTEYEIIADGPPSPATNLAFTNLTKDSVTLQWMAGFNYGHKQDFRVMQEVENGVDTELVDVDDVTDGRGGKMESTSLKGLKAGTAYSVYLVAENSQGNATQSNKVTFTTTANDDSGLSAAGVAGIVIGVLAVIVLAVVIGVVIKRRKSSYEQFDEQRPNRYSYDERP